LLAKRVAGTVVREVQLAKQLPKLVTAVLLAKRVAGIVVREVQLTKQLPKLVSPGIVGISEVDTTLALSGSVVPKLILPFAPKLPLILTV
jgi:hypothetical protein